MNELSSEKKEKLRSILIRLSGKDIGDDELNLAYKKLIEYVVALNELNTV